MTFDLNYYLIKLRRMPSYKEKYFSICNRLTTMERRVLLDESILLDLRQTILNLQTQLNNPQKELDEFLINQLHLALTELIKYANPQFQLPAHFKGKEINEILTITTEMIFNAVSLLRDATVRAQTIISDIPSKPIKDNPPSRNHLIKNRTLNNESRIILKSSTAELSPELSRNRPRSFTMSP
nr:MAG: hypothetical protein [Sclerotinia sclerotiorum negative-stranded RNA virus 1-WX]